MALNTIMRTNNLVTISFAQAVLKEAQIGHYLADQHSSMVEGSVGAIPRRLMVLDEDMFAARKVLTDAGLAHELVKG